MNHIYYAENEEQRLDTIQFAQTLCDIVEEKSDSDELIKYAKCYRLAFQLYSADYGAIIDTVPDCSIKEEQRSFSRCLCTTRELSEGFKCDSSGYVSITNVNVSTVTVDIGS